ncbi:MAG: aminoacyl-tRNA hydrolase [Verrucomicrobiae bacterium]|nr:aminoacyl-tRNA hydrolase [Verrucomicrobiae bacterium]MCB1091403.1 aminoacyl-tRNA hydrolase [Verrucomicrobiae bacterium]
MRLVIGLGNPGPRYVGTRHNVGFDLVERLAAERGLRWQTEKKWKTEISRTPDGRLVLAKPQTFMNLSGEAVIRIGSFYKIPPAAMLVIHDDVDLPLGRLRLRASGSAGGHNGLKSLIQHLGTDAFPRLKFGVGRAGEGDAIRREMIDHVLGRFDAAEADPLEKSLARATDAVNYALSHGLAAAMNRFNQNPDAEARPKQPQPPAPGRGETETQSLSRDDAGPTGATAEEPKPES